MSDPDDVRDRPLSPEGRFANCFRVGFNSNEVVVDIGQYYAGGEEARMHTRVVTSPEYALDLLEVLRSSLEAYQRRYGPIRTR
jgi:hypothetical protein